MIHAQDSKGAVLIKPASIATNGTSTGKVDCRGFDYLTIDVIADTAAAVTNKPTVLKLSEADGTSYADIVACTGGTVTSASVGFVFASMGTSASQIYTRFHLDLHKRKRYIKASVTSGTAALIWCVTGNLTRAGEMPASATEAGVGKLVIA